MQLRIVGTDGKSSELRVAANAARLGKEPGSEVPFDPAIFPMVSGQHARIDRTGDELTLTHLSGSNKTLLNGQPIEGVVKVKAGDHIRLGYTGPTVEIVAIEPAPFVTETISDIEAPKSSSSSALPKLAPPTPEATKAPEKRDIITRRPAPTTAKKTMASNRTNSRTFPKPLVLGSAAAAVVLVLGTVGFVLTRGKGREAGKPTPPPAEPPAQQVGNAKPDKPSEARPMIVELKKEPEKKLEVAVEAKESKPSTVEALIVKVKTGSAADRKNTLQDLGRLGAKARPALAVLLVALDDPDPDIRTATLETLANLGPPAKDDVPIYVVVLHEQAPQARIYAAGQLAILAPDARNELVCLRVLSLDENEAVKEAAQKAVLRIEADWLPELIQGLQNKSASVRSQNAREIANMGANAKSALPVLVEAMADSNSAVRVAVLDALLAVGPEAVVVLGEALRDKNPQVRWNAINAIGRTGSDARFVLAELIGLTFDTDLKTREEAMVALTRIGDFAIATLVQTLERERALARQQTLIEALERISYDAGPAVRAALQSAKPEAVKISAALLKKIAAQPVKSIVPAKHTGTTALMQTSLFDWFVVVDVNKDGFLDKEELGRAMRGPAAKAYDLRLPGQPVKKFGAADFALFPDYAFLHRVDRDGDGRVSRAEYDRWAFDYADIMRHDLEQRAHLQKAWARAAERGLSEAERKHRDAEVAKMWAKYRQASHADQFAFHNNVVKHATAANEKKKTK